MTEALIYFSLAEATAKSDAIDLAMGYPKEGVNIGSGPHASATQSRTYRHQSIVAHPTLPKWAYVIDAASETKLQPIEHASAVTLAPEWFPVLAAVAEEEK